MLFICYTSYCISYTVCPDALLSNYCSRPYVRSTVIVIDYPYAYRSETEPVSVMQPLSSRRSRSPARHGQRARYGLARPDRGQVEVWRLYLIYLYN